MQVEFTIAALRIFAAVLTVAVLWPRAFRPSQWTSGYARSHSRLCIADDETEAKRHSPTADQ